MMGLPSNYSTDDFSSFTDQFSKVENITELPTDAQTFFSLLTLITDIKYRLRYGEVIEYQRGSGYSEKVNNDEVLADPVSPVDDALLGT
jgi:hypothetical protein